MTPPVGVIAIAGLVAACGSSHPVGAPAKPVAVKRATSTPAPVPVPAAPAAIAFIAPSPGSSVGSTVMARVRLTGTGRVRFILDGGPARVATGLALTYRDLAPGGHRLIAQLLPSGKASAVSAAVRFRVRPAPVTTTHPAIPPEPAPVPVRPPSSPARATASPPAAPTTTHATAPAANPPTPSHASPPATTTHQTPPTTTQSQTSGGIPQGGGGDGDADNSGAPSDGDGNV